jgi:hypothetical protein
MPTASDLVTDLPADFETFGQAVATSMADLLGGTTGQVLSKASNTDMDFTWVAQDDSNAIQNAIVDAKGDLIAASAADTPARLAVGNNGESLVADSSTSTGLRYQSAYNGNAAINGGFDFWQRGTTAAIPTTYTGYLADRWLAFRAVAGATQSRQTSGLTGFNYAARIQRDSGNTATNNINYYNTFETASSLPFAGQAVTASFYARAGANFSAASNGLVFGVVTGTGTDQNPLSGFTGAAVALSGTATLTTSWQRFSFTGTIGSSVTQLAPYVQHVPTGTAGANDYFEITGFQFELGSVATTFKRAGGTIQGELAACQRYYYRNSSIDSNTVFGSGWGWTGTQATLILNTKVTMRTKPSALDYSSINLQAVPAGTTYAITSWTLDTGLLGADTIATIPVVASGLTASLNYRLIGASASAYVGLSAEL